MEKVNIQKREIVEEMRQSYLEYAMSVIVARALPDVRDGLKPVHRRVLYSMHEMGLRPGAKYQKSAKVVGQTMGHYHPHGDTAIYDSLVRMAQDFSLRYPLVDGQGNFGCFIGDTKVMLTDGRELSFIELTKESEKGKKNYTYTFNHGTQAIEIAEILNPRRTKTAAQLVEVTLDNGQKVRCTPDHSFMLRNGAYKEAQYLVSEDSLMPIYSRLSTKKDDVNAVGYKMIHQPIKNIWDWAHRLADKFNIDKRVYKNSDGRVRHHIDFNKLNNNPDNIRRMHWADHWKLHYELISERHKNDPEYTAKLKAGRDKYFANPVNKQKISRFTSERNKQWWQDPKYRQGRIDAVKKLWLDVEYKDRMRVISSKNLKNLWKQDKFRSLLGEIKSEELKKRWKDKDYRDYMANVTKEFSIKLWANPAHRTHISELNKKKWLDEDLRKKRGEFSKKLWNNPTYRAKFADNHFSEMAKALWSDPKTVQLHSEKAKKQWGNSEFRKKVSNEARKRGLELVKENPDYMQAMAQKAALSLSKKWKDPIYRERVVKSKVLNYVNKLLVTNPSLTPSIYEDSRKSKGIPGLRGAMNYFKNFEDIVSQAKIYNHKVVEVNFLKDRESVYDLTIKGSHNFALAVGVFVHNSIDADAAAAMRYTECRMAKITEELIADIDKDTVSFQDNYDGSVKEPTVFPSKIPNLLVNGSMGIAVGMATNIPPHNLTEILDASIHLIDNKDADVVELVKFVKGPDFPTGGVIYNERDIVNAYATGRGPVIIRGVANIVEGKKGFQIIITEIPYQVNKAELIIKMADLVKEKRIEGIRDIRDESDRDGLRITIDLKQDAFPRKILNQLFKYTELQKAFHFNMLGLVDGIQPQILGLKSLLEKFLEHRKEIITRRSKFELQKNKDRAHILEGLKRALDHIDAIIKIIRSSDSKEDAFNNLIKRFKFSDKQTTAILEMKLQALAGLERKKIDDELKGKKELIAYLEDLLASPKKILGVIKEELKQVREKYGDERRTKVIKSPLKELGEEELVPEEDSLFMLTRGGYIKRMQPEGIRSQKRGGKGLVGMATKEEDVVTQFFLANTHDNLLFFTNSGKVFQTKGYEVPETSRQSKGKAIVNFLQVSPSDLITAVVPISKDQRGAYLFMITASGVVKKVDMDSFSQVRRTGMVAIKLKGGDELKWVLSTSGKDQVMLVTSGGNAIRFKENNVRPMGRAAAGVIGIRIEKGQGEGLRRGTSAGIASERVVGADVVPAGVEKGLHILIVTENGYGKRSDLKFYKVQNRGGRGIMTAKVTPRTGKVVSAHIVSEENKELVAVSGKGQVIRTQIDSISILGRATQGVRVMKLESGDGLASVAMV